MRTAKKIEIDLRDEYGFSDEIDDTRVVVVDWEMYQSVMKSLDVETRDAILGKSKIAVSGFVKIVEEEV